MALKKNCFPKPACSPPQRLVLVQQLPTAVLQVLPLPGAVGVVQFQLHQPSAAVLVSVNHLAARKNIYCKIFFLQAIFFVCIKVVQIITKISDLYSFIKSMNRRTGKPFGCGNVFF